jgi:hypothetical protein
MVRKKKEYIPYTKKDVEESRKSLELKAKKSNKEIKERILASKDLTLEEKEILAYDLLSSPQSYGPFIEKLNIIDIGATKIPATNNQGDYVTQQGTINELKVGLFDRFGDTNIPQCRPYQNIDNYTIKKYDPIGHKTITLNVPSHEIKKICGEINCSTHGSKENRNDETSIKISLNPKHKVPYGIFLRLKKYLADESIDIRSLKV